MNKCIEVVKELQMWSDKVFPKDQLLIFGLYSPYFGVSPYISGCGQKKRDEAIRRAMSDYEMEEEEAYTIVGDYVYVHDDYLNYLENAVFTNDDRELFEIMFSRISMQIVRVGEDKETKMKDLLDEEKAQLIRKLFGDKDNPRIVYCEFDANGKEQKDAE